MTFTRSGAAGTNVSFLHGEILDDKGFVLQSNLLPGQVETTAYIFRDDGSPESFEPMFVYYGFRYVQIQGLAYAPSVGDIEAYFVHTALNESSISFGGSDKAQLLSQIQTITHNSAVSNFYSIPTDCPQREKRGWLGDGQAACETMMYNFDMEAAYVKWLRDIQDAQLCADNNFPEVAPWMFGNGHCSEDSDPAWGSGMIAVMGWVYQYFGDVTAYTKNYDSAVKYMKYLTQYLDAKTGLLPTSYPGTRYGDWCAPEAWNSSDVRHTSALINSFYWIRQLRVMVEASALLKRTEDYNQFTGQLAKASTSFVSEFYDATKGVFTDPNLTPQDGPLPVQTAQALGLTLVKDTERGNEK